MSSPPTNQDPGNRDPEIRDGGNPLAAYQAAVRTVGSGFPATLWASPATQILRFDVLIDMLGPERLRDRVVMDLGCGDGALGHRLVERGIRVARYVGIDGVLEQVQAAQRRGFEQSVLVCEDLLASGSSLGRFGAGVAMISGTLNTMTQDQAQTLVRAAFEAVSVGVCFNFLSNRPASHRLQADLGPAVRHDVLGWLDFSLSLSPLVSFRQDHLEGHDGTILITHPT